MAAGLGAQSRASTIRRRRCRTTASLTSRSRPWQGFLLAKTDSDLLANVHLDAATPEQIAHGKSLVMEYGCASCHEIAGIKKPENFAPELTRIGSKSVSQLIFLPGMPHTLPDYIAGKIRQPRAFAPGLKMPQYSFTPTQIDALTTALLAQNDRAQTMPPSLAVAAPPASHYQPAGKAGQLMTDLACFSCHAINGRGGDMAPDLTWEGSSVQRKWLEDFFRNPNTLRPALIRRMPKFNLSDEDITTLSDYIMTVYQTPEFDRDSMPESGYSRNPGGTRTAAFLFQVRLPVLPHRRCQSRQRLHRADADRGRLALDRCVDLSLAKEPAGTAPRHDGTQSQHE